MKNESPDPPDSEPTPELSPEDEALFGLEDASERWVDHVAAALAPTDPGWIGPYRILEEVRRGGQGVVYRAEQRGTERLVALKRLLAGSFADGEARARFEREVEVLVGLRHPGIVTVLAVEESDGAPVLVMEWIDGLTITEWAKARRLRSFEAVVELFLGAARAVQHAHQNGVLHRDLKPSNVLVDTAGRVCVLDFGLAKHLAEDAHGSSLTRTHAFFGTIAYASPEQLRDGSSRLDVRSDVYALGVLLYELLSGSLPHDHELGFGRLLEARERESHLRLRMLRTDCPADLDAVVHKTLAARPEDRYASVSSLIEDLERYLRHEPVAAHPPSTWYELKKVVRRNRAASLLAAALFVMVLAIAVRTRHHAAVLAGERDAERRAREAAVEAEVLAREEATRSSLLLEYFVSDVFRTLEPGCSYEDLSVREFLGNARELAATRFVDQPGLQASVLHALGLICSRLGFLGDAEGALREALALAEEGPHGPEPALVALQLGRSLSMQGRGREAVELLGAWLAELEDGNSSSLRRMQFNGALSGACMGIGDWQRVGYLSEKTLAATDGLGPEFDPYRFDALGALAASQAQLGRIEDARETYARGLRLAGRSDMSPAVEAELLAGVANIDRFEGHFAQAREKLRRSLEITREVYGSSSSFVASAAADLASVLMEPEHLFEGEGLLREAIDVRRSVDPSNGEIEQVYRLRLAENLVFQERYDEALELLDVVAPVFEATGGPTHHRMQEVRRWRAEALHGLGETGAALDLWEEVFQVATGRGDPVEGMDHFRARYGETLRALGSGALTYDRFDQLYLAQFERDPASLSVLCREAARWYAAWPDDPLATERGAAWRAMGEE